MNDPHPCVSRISARIQLMVVLWLMSFAGRVIVFSQTTVLWSEGFELLETNGLPGNWSSEGDVWEAGVPTYGPLTNQFGLRAYAGTNVAATVLAGDYYDYTGDVGGVWFNGVRGRLVSPEFVVPSASQNPRLRWWQWFSFNAGDFGEVQIKVGTNDWVAVSDRFTGPSSGAWSSP